MNTPITQKEVRELPKGYHPAKAIGIIFRRALISKRAQFIITSSGHLEIVYNYHPNSRKLTEGRKSYKQLKFGRLHG